MNYIIMDMEWNQAISSARMVRSPVVLHGEVIQIGAVKTDENFKLVDKFKINIRPKYYKKMNPYVEKITGITSADLTCGEIFPLAFKRFSAWCGEEFRIITWGFDDIGVLADNLALHGIEGGFGSDYINLQLIFNKQTNSEHLQCALSAAAESLEIPIDVQVHDAANDAYLTYEVTQKLDMVKGIAEYSEMSQKSAAAVPISKEYIEKVDAAKNLVRDRRVAEIKCPRCGKKTALREWIFSGGKSAKTIASCPEDGEFIIKLKASRVSDTNYTVTRSIFEASEEEKQAFAKKLKKRAEAAERRRKRIEEEMKKTEENDEKNDNV